MNLPALSTRDAKLPARYEAAKAAISECAQIDECKEWANKAEALASYARQAKDDALERTAQQIKVRAIRRAGDLLKEIEKAKNQHEKSRRAKVGAVPSRKEAARSAGLSERQQKEAIRIASIPKEKFEKEVESEKPPTVARFSAMGVDKQKRKEVFDRIAKESSKAGFKEATYAVGALEDFVASHCSKAAALIAGGTSKHQRAKIKRLIREAIRWLTEFDGLLGE